jgi:mannan endo-1,4-beta-mannosidase
MEITMKKTLFLAAMLGSFSSFAAATNRPPTITMTSPSTTTVNVLPGANVTFVADVHDPDGDSTISKVEFYHDSWAWFGGPTKAPYQATYKSIPAGTHPITVRVTDTSGAATLTSMTVVAAEAKVAPTITITSPTKGEAVHIDSPLLIKVDAHDANGDSTISKVEFYHDNYSWFGASSTAPYQATYNGITSGSHAIIARVTDATGLATITSITVDASLPALRPDLIVTSQIYSNGVFTAVVKNQGTAAVAKGTAVSAEFSVDGVSTVKTSATLKADLNIGESTNITGSVSPVLAYGTHTILANVNSSGAIKELDTTNNTRSDSMVVFAQPDLYVSSINYKQGIFSAVIGNRGDLATTAGQEIRVSFSIDGVTKTYQATTTSIAAGKTLSVPATTSVSVAQGTHTMSAMVDDLNALAESNETNNSLSVTLAPPTSVVNVRAFSADSVASISFQTPNGAANNSSITNYLVTASNGMTASGTSSPIIMNGLTNGVAYTFKVTVTNSMGQTVSDSSNSTTPNPVSAFVPAHATRPSYNTGHGLFVLDGKIYDANGVEFNIRGVNKVHHDTGSSGIATSKSNTERIALNFTKTTTYNLGVVNKIISNHIVPIPGSWDGTCSEDPTKLTAIVDTWVAQADAWKTLNDQMILNIANEWGPTNSTVWRDSYITAIKRLRDAGYTMPISVTSGGCGQSIVDITNYAQEVFNSDPQKNIIFDVHVYGGTTSANVASNFAALKATGLAIMIGEFGPGRNIGPSPTLLTPGEVITEADKNGLGWLAWGWDDNSSVGAEDYWFQMSILSGYDYPYRGTSDLTIFGRDVVENPVYGLKVKSVYQTAY